MIRSLCSLAIALLLLAGASATRADDGGPLPPIFEPGNKVSYIISHGGQTTIGILVVKQVRGEWILVLFPASTNPVWIHPSTMDASWWIP